MPEKELKELQKQYDALSKDYEAINRRLAITESMNSWSKTLTGEEIDDIVMQKITMEMVHFYSKAGFNPLSFIHLVSSFAVEYNIHEEVDEEEKEALDSYYDMIPVSLREMLKLGMRTSTVLHRSIREFLEVLEEFELERDDDE